MSRRADFLLLVQSGLLAENLDVAIIVQRMSVAVRIPEEILPRDLGKAAWDLILFLDGRIDPEWIVKWKKDEAESEQASRELVTIKLNPGSDSDAWWMNAERCADSPLLPAVCVPIVCDRIESIRVRRSDAESFIEWGESIPGWEWGAPPFLFEGLPPRKRGVKKK